jgi:pimeloyl-ACP methyl ester carboxylesterase
MTTTHRVPVPGASIHYEVRGSGPVLVIAGSPMAARFFSPLAGALAGDHTVITHDPRGISNSPLADPTAPGDPNERADDIVAILDAVGAEQADVFGSSGGAVTGLALVTRHPSRVRTLVAHEPPLLTILPDAAEQMEITDDIVATFHRDGIGPAFGKFMAQAGFDQTGGAPEPDADGTPPDAEWQPSEQDLADSVRMFGYDILGTTRYRPDVAALTARPGQVVLGIGAESGSLLTYRTTAALAALLGLEMVEFPGDHGGFMPEPVAFAATLRSVLAGSTARV